MRRKGGRLVTQCEMQPKFQGAAITCQSQPIDPLIADDPATSKQRHEKEGQTE